MKISKTAWHARLMVYFFDTEGHPPQKNLCQYFWQLAFLMFGIIALSPIWVPIVLIIRANAWLEKKFPAKETPKAEPTGEPRTLIGQWLKAKKERVCPLLEWTE